MRCLEFVQSGQNERRDPIKFSGVHMAEHPLHRIPDRTDLAALLVVADDLELGWLVCAAADMFVQDIMCLPELVETECQATVRSAISFDSLVCSSESIHECRNGSSAFFQGRTDHR